MKKRVLLAGVLLVAVLVVAGAVLGVADKITGNGQAGESAMPEDPTQESSCEVEGDGRFLFCSLAGCPAPCWQGLWPGATNWAQVGEWVESRGSDIEGWKCRDRIDLSDLLSTRCSGSDLALEITVDILVHDDRVWSVSLAPGRIIRDPEEMEEVMATAWAEGGERSRFESGTHAALFGLTLADAVAFLGDPDEYSAIVMRQRDGDIWSMIGLYYEEGILIETSLEDHTSIDRGFPPTCKIEIGPDLPITSAQFYDVALGVSWRSILAPAPREPWQGFGEVDVTECGW